MIKLSIVVPAYNVNKYIADTINSVLSYHGSNIEVIVVNDGSTDQTEETIKTFLNDARLILFTQENKGLGSARNAGVDQASGDYITFLDGDDKFEDNVLGDLLEYLDSKRPDILLCKPVWSYPSGYKKIAYLEKWFTAENTQKNLREVERFAIGCPIATSKFFKKELIDSISFPINQTGEDVFFSLQTWYNSKDIRSLDKTVYLRTERQEADNKSITQTFNLKIIKDRQKVIEDCVLYAKKHNLKVAEHQVVTSTLAFIENRIHLLKVEELVEAKRILTKIRSKYLNSKKIKLKVFLRKIYYKVLCLKLT